MSDLLPENAWKSIADAIEEDFIVTLYIDEEPGEQTFAIVLARREDEYYAIESGYPKGHYDALLARLKHRAKQRSEPWSWAGPGVDIYMWSLVGLFAAMLVYTAFIQMTRGLTGSEEVGAIFGVCALLLAMLLPPLIMGKWWRLRAERIKVALQGMKMQTHTA